MVNETAVAYAITEMEMLGFRAILTFAIYHYIETPVRRTARRIAFSGHWKY